MPSLTRQIEYANEQTVRAIAAQALCPEDAHDLHESAQAEHEIAAELAGLAGKAELERRHQHLAHWHKQQGPDGHDE